MDEIKINDIIEVTVTGIQKYGAFVLINDKYDGLIHISEISDGYVKDVGRFVQMNETVTVKVIDVDENTNQARLSLKAVHPTSFRKVRGRRKDWRLPEMKLGFTSIEEKMDEWINQALKEREQHD
jgi:predicted RNA-binding protein with RPS1 domain